MPAEIEIVGNPVTEAKPVWSTFDVSVPEDKWSSESPITSTRPDDCKVLSLEIVCTGTPDIEPMSTAVSVGTWEVCSVEELRIFVAGVCIDEKLEEVEEEGGGGKGDSIGPRTVGND